MEDLYSLRGRVGGELKMLRLIVSATLLALLGGCAVTDTKMVNNQGQTAECRAFGAGIIGTVAALAMTKDCVDKHTEQGYHQVPKTSAAATPTDRQTR